MNGDVPHNAKRMPEETLCVLYLKNNVWLKEYRSLEKGDRLFESNTLVKKLEFSYCGLVGCDSLFFGRWFSPSSYLMSKAPGFSEISERTYRTT